MIARIHSSETMGSVDGPGLRYVLFLQGCNMRCLYCHNRDTWNVNGGEEIELSSLIRKINALKGFYNRDEGGITVSGGEPLLQSGFISELFDAVHKMGLTSAIDTSGHTLLTEDVKKCISKTDYLLMDVKSLDDKVHKALAGVDRSLVNPFFEYVKGQDTKIWLRYVYVPGYTDSDQDCESLVEFICSFSNIKRVDILPYHVYGKEKWENLGYKYPLEGLEPPTEEEVQKFRGYIKEHTKVIVK